MVTNVRAAIVWLIRIIGGGLVVIGITNDSITVIKTIAKELS